MKEKINNNNKIKVSNSIAWLFPYKRKGLSINTQSTIAYYLFQNKISLTLINWIFQGMRSMGIADLIGKLLLDVILFCLFYAMIIFFRDAGHVYYIFIAIVFAHTVNWLLNAHFWDVGRFLGITRTSPERFFPYIRKIMNRVAHSHSIRSVIVIGGVTRNAGFRETSDVDMIFIKEKGIINTINAVYTAVRERAMAFFCKFPLHLELYDNIKNVHHRIDEVPILLKDDSDLVKNWYNKRGRNTAVLDDFDE